MLRIITGGLSLKVASKYSATCNCGKVSVQQTGTAIDTRCKESRRYLRLGRALAEQKHETGHKIDFSSSFILDKAMGYINHVMKEVFRSCCIPETSTGTKVSLSFSPGIR
jgi:hypothetical protein